MAVNPFRGTKAFPFVIVRRLRTGGGEAFAQAMHLGQAQVIRDAYAAHLEAHGCTWIEAIELWAYGMRDETDTRCLLRQDGSQGKGVA